MLWNRFFVTVSYFVNGTVGYAIPQKFDLSEMAQAKTLPKSRDNKLDFLEKLSLMMTKKLNEQVKNYSQHGKYQQALVPAERALTIRETILGGEHPFVAQSLNSLAELYSQIGEYVRAEPRYRRALEIRRKTLGEDHFEVAASLNNLAKLYVATGEYARAEPRYRRALDILIKHFGEEHFEVAASLNNLAELDKKMGEYARAESLLKPALDIQTKNVAEEERPYGFLDHLERAFQTASPVQSQEQPQPLLLMTH